MSTAGDIVTKALRKARLIGVDTTPSAEDMSDGLDTLNLMLDSWWLERLAVYRVQDDAFTWAAGNASRTIGATGVFVGTRPNKITGAYFRDGTTDYVARVATDRSEYDGIVDKTVQGVPALVFYDPSYPDGTLYAYPVPDRAYSAHIQSHARIESFATSAETASLPPGYERAIVANLAVELCGDYGQEASASLQRTAMKAKRTLRMANTPTQILGMPAGLGSARVYNVISDQ